MERIDIAYLFFIGIIGGPVGKRLMLFLGIEPEGGLIWNLLVSTSGAVIILVIVHAVMRMELGQTVSEEALHKTGENPRIAVEPPKRKDESSVKAAESVTCQAAEPEINHPLSPGRPTWAFLSSPWTPWILTAVFVGKGHQLYSRTYDPILRFLILVAVVGLIVGLWVAYNANKAPSD